MFIIIQFYWLISLIFDAIMKKLFLENVNHRHWQKSNSITSITKNFLPSDFKLVNITLTFLSDKISDHRIPNLKRLCSVTNKTLYYYISECHSNLMPIQYIILCYFNILLHLHWITYIYVLVLQTFVFRCIC